MSEKRLASSGDSFVDLTEMQTVDLLNKLSDENTRLHKKVDEQQTTINKLKSDIEETEISIKLFEDDIATKDKKIEEQQAEIERLQKIIDLTQYQLKVQDRILKEVGE